MKIENIIAKVANKEILTANEYLFLQNGGIETIDDLLQYEHDRRIDCISQDNTVFFN